MFFIATTDGNQPHVRPFGVAEIVNGKLYLTTGRKKDVYKQLEGNDGRFEICALKPDYSRWIRISGRLKTFNRYTKAKEAIAASSAFPGVFSPVQIEGRLYCDGGILANFPAHIIQGRCDFLIGVNLDTQETAIKKSKELDSTKSVVFRAIEIMMMQNMATQDNLCDWCIFPLKSTDYSTFEMSKDRMDEIFNLGYEAAKKGFKTVREKLIKANKSADYK